MWNSQQMDTGEHNQAPPIEKGWYNFFITEAGIKTTKAGTGRQLFLKGVIVGGPKDGMTVMNWIMFEMNGRNEEDWIKRNNALIGRLMTVCQIQSLDPNVEGAATAFENKQFSVHMERKDDNLNWYDFQQIAAVAEASAAAQNVAGQPMSQMDAAAQLYGQPEPIGNPQHRQDFNDDIPAFP